MRRSRPGQGREGTLHECRDPTPLTYRRTTAARPGAVGARPPRRPRRRQGAGHLVGSRSGCRLPQDHGGGVVAVQLRHAVVRGEATSLLRRATDPAVPARLDRSGPAAARTHLVGHSDASRIRTARPRRPSHPQRDSNPCYRLERAASWATGRWGLTRKGPLTVPEACATTAPPTPPRNLPSTRRRRGRVDDRFERWGWGEAAPAGTESMIGTHHDRDPAVGWPADATS